MYKYYLHFWFDVVWVIFFFNDNKSNRIKSNLQLASSYVGFTKNLNEIAKLKQSKQKGWFPYFYTYLMNSLLQATFMHSNKMLFYSFGAF